MRLVCLSDTHNHNERIRVPDGDVLVHAGDATFRGTVEEIEKFASWYRAMPHRTKVFVAGNHDWLFLRDNAAARDLLGGEIVYLQDSTAEIGGFKFYGAPWQPRFYDWAFNLERGSELAERWRLIPDDTDVLVTHGPPNGILDEVPTPAGSSHEGCEQLRKRVDELSDRLRIHIFGHIHCGYGVYEENGVTFVNASICDEGYKAANPPLIIDI